MMLSLFPEHMVNNPVNPASMFVGFISAKQYFSVITRRIIENYKLNLFDVSLDPFEVKIWFWDIPTIKVKDVDFYYGYVAAANLNGYANYSPGQIAHMVALLAAVRCLDISERYERHYALHFIYAVYLLTFIFQSKIKQFPYANEKQNFAWMVDLLFSFYELLLEQSEDWFTQDTIKDIKASLLREHMELFFMLLYFYQYTSRSLDVAGVTQQQFFWRLFYDQIQSWDLQNEMQYFIAHCERTVLQTSFTMTEKKILHIVFPADILIKYILDVPSVSASIRHMITHFFQQEKIQEYMLSFLTSDAKFKEFVTYLTDYTRLKKSYFVALKKYITHTFQKTDSFSLEENKQIDEWLSMISDGGNLDMTQVPERLKQESEMMERLMNFYVTYIGGAWIGRGDSWYIRCFYPQILQQFQQQIQRRTRLDGSFYYSSLLQNYSRNTFYYKHAFENIRAGKEKFNLPFRPTFRETYSNLCIVKLFETNFLTTLLQDILPKEIKTYTKNKEIIKEFARLFEKQIHHLAKKNYKDLIDFAYGIYDTTFFDQLRYKETLLQHKIEDSEIHLKENLYSLDFWIYTNFLQKLAPYAQKLKDVYSDASVVWVLALTRETLFWFLLYYVYLKTKGVETTTKKKKKWYETPRKLEGWSLEDEIWTELLTQEDMHIDVLISYYVVDVLVLSEEFVPIFSNIISWLVIDYADILQMFTGIDDNNTYLKIAKENWLQYCRNKTSDQIFAGILWEDTIWFRWFLKTISYYSKRYILP